MNFLLNLFSGSYEELWKAIIRPYRDEYTDKDLGPEKFRLNSKYYKRTDFSLRNSRNQLLMCSFWEPYDEERPYSRLPCVIYLHGNSSSRCEVIPNLKYLLPLNITVFSFDFAACGRSEGEYISLGYYEVLDVKCVINFLRNTHKVGPIGLWGRSMGAVTSIMYAAKDPTIAGIFLDSPFFSLNLLMDELSKEKVSLPGFLIKKVLEKIKETVKEKAGFNIDDINTDNYCKKCFVPAFFCHGKDDTFVKVHHCNDLYMTYPGEKDILIVEGDHNDTRPNELNEKAAEFFYYALKCKYIKEINNYYIGYKLYINDWINPDYITPGGNNNKNNNKNEINNYDDIFENGDYSETINIAKNEPKNNYSKKSYNNKKNIQNNNSNNNTNLKFNNKLKYKIKSIKPKFPEQEQNRIYFNENNININNNLNNNNKIKQNNLLTKNLKLNYSNDNITNVNFNNFKKIQVHTGSLYPQDSFKYKKNSNKNNVIINNEIEQKQKLIFKTEFNDKSDYKDNFSREIIKINFQNTPKYNYTNYKFNNRTNNSVNKYRINNNLILLNNTNNTPINKTKNIISFMPSQPNLNIKYPTQTIKTNNQNYFFDNNSSFNNNLNSALSNNIYKVQNKNRENGNNYYNITNNNIFINQFQNIYN